jgi:hypothetical protein
VHGVGFRRRFAAASIFGGNAVIPRAAPETLSTLLSPTGNKKG